ncbi:hypothetical protein CUJ87_09290 [Paraburkholderia caledonica]|nr:hypothetical protein CUJ87_09290 [Paraburkholderia caledonica]
MGQRKPRLIFTTMLTLCTAWPAFAQDAPPTDTDLRASYCMAVIREEQANTKAMFPQVETDRASIPQPIVKSWTEAADRLNHLTLYLLPRTQYVDSTGLLAANSRGRRDAQKVESPEMMACAERCDETMRRGTPEELKACLRPCDPEMLPRVWACNDLSWLPF